MSKIHMPGPKVSQQNIDQIITLLLSSCCHLFLRSTMYMHPPFTWSKKKKKHDSSDQAAFFHCSMVQFWWLNAHLGAFSCGQGSSWALYFLSIKFFRNLSYSSSSVWSGWSCSSHLHQWALATQDLTMAHRLSFIARLLVGINHWIVGTLHKSCRFGDALTLWLVI